MVDIIQNAYNVFEQLHLSVTGLLVASIVFALAFLFAVREAASWFFKVDDVKRDIRRLHEVTTQLEGEIKVVQTLLAQIREPLEQRSSKATAVEPVPVLVVEKAASKNEKAAESNPAAPADETQLNRAQNKASGFPIVH